MGVSETTRIGTVLAGYRVESLLGRGGMSVVYLAEHIRLGRKVALKVLAAPLALDDSFRERFVRESQRAADLDHPNVIPIYDAGEVDSGDAGGPLYIAMRYVSGSDLRSMLKQEGRLSLGRTLFILEQVAGALDAAHDRALIHRDVKPANILIADPSEHVFLTDFGVAKQTTAPELTRTGVFVGTADYAAPEQIEGLTLDRRTDVYALGCVLYECLAGRPPFDREAEVAVMHAHLALPPPKLTDVRPDLPRELDRVIAAAMAKSRDDRFATAPELIEAARNAVLQRGPTSAQTIHGTLEGLLEPSLQEPVQPPPPSLAAPPVQAPPPSLEEPVQAPPPSPPVPAGPEPVQAAREGGEPGTPPAPPSSSADGPLARTPRWLLTAILVAVAAVASATVAYLVVNDDEEGTGTAAPSATTAPAPALPASSEPTLSDLVPNQLWKDCAVDNVPRAGAVESAVCLPPGDLSVQNSPDRWQIAIYPNAEALDAAYTAQKKLGNIAGDGGRCDGTFWGGSGPWLHPPNKPGGKRFCYFDGDDAVMVWTHEKLGQPTHRDMLAIAREGGTDHAGLFNWWRFWHHRIGKAAS